MATLTRNYCIDEHFSAVSGKDYEVISNKCGFDEIDSVEIACERFADILGSEYCIMDKKTEINASNFVVGDLRDEGVAGINFEFNTAIEYLPYKIHMQLPNLVNYVANHCSVKQITKENFEKLTRLKYILLLSNQIQKIPGNTFKGLEGLVSVDLSGFVSFILNLQ